MKHVIISPSILSADFGLLAEQMRALKEAGCDTIHVDVMDGMFVPNITFGQAVLKSIAKHAPLPLDVHLMINDPGRYIADFALEPVQSITVHVEACTHLDRVLQQIIETGKKPGVAVNPATPLCGLRWSLDKLWMVMLMTVNPGFGGQSFIPLYDKIEECKKLIDARGSSAIIGIDGGVTNKNAARIVSAGADYLVAGSYIFSGEPTIKAAADALREATL